MRSLVHLRPHPPKVCQGQCSQFSLRSTIALACPAFWETTELALLRSAYQSWYSSHYRCALYYTAQSNNNSNNNKQ